MNHFSEPLLSLANKLLEQQVAVETWFRQQWQETRPPLYGSVDLRNAGYKLAPVDTNIFPAGFNNLNPEFMPLYVQAVQATIAEICPDVTRLLLIPESHTRNIFYFENVAMLHEILSKAGFEVRIGTLAESITSAQDFSLPSGRTITVEPLKREGDRIGVDNFFPCCIILNNDLSAGVPDIFKEVSQKIMPSVQLGWSTRLKSEHFKYYKEVVQDFAKLLDFDEWLLLPWFDRCPEVDFMNRQGQACLTERAESLFKQLHQKYAEYKIPQKPFLVIKADRGTYGMAVMMIRDPKELAELNRKQRTRMSTLKGGATVTKAIIQEGVYTFEKVGAQNSIAEPVVYMIGRCVVGGFYRVHDSKGPDENLNAPGMNFHPLPFSDPCNVPAEQADTPAGQHYIYGVVARLALLAAARELAFFERG